MTVMRIIVTSCIVSLSVQAFAGEDDKAAKRPVVELSQVQALPPSGYIIELYDVPIEVDETARRIVIEPLSQTRIIPRAATYTLIRDSEAFISAENPDKNLKRTGAKRGMSPEGRRVDPLKPVAAIGIRSKF